jgi:hypothetical protein
MALSKSRVLKAVPPLVVASNRVSKVREPVRALDRGSSSKGRALTPVGNPLKDKVEALVLGSREKKASRASKAQDQSRVLREVSLERGQTGRKVRAVKVGSPIRARGRPLVTPVSRKGLTPQRSS